MLTLVDLFTAFIIVKKAGTIWGIVFLFTPQAVWVASRNYQFNNIAVLLAFLGVLCIEDSAGEKRITLNDIAGTLLLSLSLIMKHILWMFPMWILFSTKTDARKKILYAIIPPLLFFLSFVPYWSEGSQGIIQHVFMYRAGNNFPLLGVGLLNKYGIILPYQGNLCLAVFGLLMILGAYIFRREKIFNLFLVYLIAQVCFSSGISVTFLAIPAASLIIIFRKWSLIYFALGVITRLLVRGNVATAVSMYENNIARIGMFMPMVWCLLVYLVYYYFRLSEKAPRVL